jgi:hypothetical protein
MIGKTPADIAPLTELWSERVGRRVKVTVSRKAKGSAVERTGRVVYANRFIVGVKFDPEKGKGPGYVETFTASEIYLGLVKIEEMEGETE